MVNESYKQRFFFIVGENLLYCALKYQFEKEEDRNCNIKI